jgi:uncharacterized protein
MIDHFVLDIETCPKNLVNYSALSDEEQIKLLNPIDSRIVAIGIRHEEKNYLFMQKDEKELLQEFWDKWRELFFYNTNSRVVGFNIQYFDMPFIVTRSLINNVVIQPFSLKVLIDLREKINAYRYGKSRGKLKDFAQSLGIETENIDGSAIPRLCQEENWEKIKVYLEKDLLLTDKLFERCIDTKIIGISRY